MFKTMIVETFFVIVIREHAKKWKTWDEILDEYIDDNIYDILLKIDFEEMIEKLKDKGFFLLKRDKDILKIKFNPELEDLYQEFKKNNQA